MIDPEFASAAEWARLYRAKAIQVVPACSHVEVKPGTAWKRPLFSSWTEFQEALVPDDKFNEWYGPHGQYVARLQMGTICGRASGGTFVVDLDTHKHPTAAAWWQGLLAVHNNGMPLETPEQRTGGGGLQKLFRAPPGWTPPTCKTSIGVDIRGQGGFAMLAPSMHESGRAYEWLEGLSPDEVEIMVAPDWLVAAIDALVAQYGGGGSTKSSEPKTASSFSSGTYDGFGHQVDGREEYMRDLIWAAVVDWRRECPIKPGEAESHAKMVEKYGVYEQGVSPRVYEAALTKTQMLDREGRGPGLFHVKWRAAMKLWDSKVFEEAKQPGKSDNYRAHDYTDEFKAEPRVDPATGHPLPLIQTGTDFVGAYRPPDYLIDNLIQKGYLYSLTGPTGHGKTPTAMLMGIRVALGRPFHGRPTTQGSVLFLAGENSDDIRARYVALSDHEKFDIATTPFYFIDGVIDIRAEMPRIEAEAATIPNLSMVIIDTDQAYFLGDEGNSNEQRKWFAKTLRQLLKLPGNPTALVNCHPVKNATQDNLVPLGGSSFLNEVDGNIQCWAEDRTTTIKPHATKWRGTAFESMAFDLKTVTSDRLKDTKGRHISSVMAVEISDEGAARRGAVLEEDDKSVLRMYYRDKNASLASIAKALGWLWPNGAPARNKVQRTVDRLKKSKMLYNYHGEKCRITKKGAKHIGEKWGGEDDE
jgi:hypothetical protein